MIQVYYIYCVLYFCYWYIVIYNEIIIQLPTIKDQWGLWTCFPATRQSHLGVMGDRTVTLEVCCLCPVFSIISFWLPLLQKTLLHKDRILEIEANSSVLLWQSQENKSYCQIKHDSAHFQSKAYLLTLRCCEGKYSVYCKAYNVGPSRKNEQLMLKRLVFQGKVFKESVKECHRTCDQLMHSSLIGWWWSNNGNNGNSGRLHFLAVQSLCRWWPQPWN